mgnify:CR=1 FL=1
MLLVGATRDPIFAARLCYERLGKLFVPSIFLSTVASSGIQSKVDHGTIFFLLFDSIV